MHWRSRPSRSPTRQLPPQPDSTQAPARINSIFPTLGTTTNPGHQRSRSHIIPESPSQNPSSDWSKRNDKYKGATLKTGRCMTCHSLVRWPEQLLTFRCSICGTVNDLPPTVDTKPQWRNHKQSVSDVGFNRSRPPPLSVGKIQDMIRGCMAEFLQSQLDGTTPLSLTALSASEDAAPRKITHTKSLPIPTPQISAELYATSSYPPTQTNARPGLSRTPSPSPTPVILLHPPSRAPPPPPSAPSGDQQPRSNKESNSGLERCHPGKAAGVHASKQEQTPERAFPSIFKPVEDYIAFCFSQWDSLMSSFRKIPQNGAAEFLSATNQETRRKPCRPRHGIDWDQVEAFYSAIANAGVEEVSRLFDEPAAPPSKSKSKWKGKSVARGDENAFDPSCFDENQRMEIVEIVDNSRHYLKKTLLKATENLLRRPGRQLAKAEDMRVILILLENPSIYAASALSARSRRPDGQTDQRTSQYSSIIKRLLGLMGNANVECHNSLVPWFSELDEKRFRRLVEICNRFITSRLTRHLEKESTDRRHGEALIPSSSYKDDWQIRAAARCMSLLYHANKMGGATRRRAELGRKDDISSSVENPHQLSERKAADRGLLISLDEFYNSMVDMIVFRSDFELWESGSTEFTFCQYSFLFTLGTKTQILEYDAQRQMKRAIHDAFFSSIGGGRRTDAYLTLRVRRDCLAEDSIAAVKEAIGGDAGANLKKQLRVHFLGEEGIDAGGIRKEWFLLIIRELFNPDNGIFLYDEESRYCYFNPNSLETSELYFNIGVLLGLAIYNSIILDIALPPVVFRKLLAPTLKSGLSKSGLHSAASLTPHSLDDLAVFRPSLAKGLKMLLQYEGDVETAFGLFFSIDVEAYGKFESPALCPDGENRPVTNDNRKEYVQLYVNYIIDVAVKKQFDPFKRGFIEVLRSNSLDLFEPQEIENLVRGSDEGVEVDGLRAVAKYNRFRSLEPDSDERVVAWFWKLFGEAAPDKQRNLLRFITASDRIPALGAQHLVIEIENGGNDTRRYPIARTCFNRLILYEYESEEILAQRLWRAVEDSEGFGLK